MTTALDICNNALMMLGQSKMTSLSEDSDKARLADGIYTQVRDRILRGHPWNCAVKRAVLESPAFSPSDKSALLAIVGRAIERDSTAAAWAAALGTKTVTGGKLYFEVKVDNLLTDFAIGVAMSAADLSKFIGGDAYGWGYRANTGNKANNNSASAYGSTYTAGDIIGVALDLDNGKLWFAKNNTWQNTGDPVAGTNAAFTGLSGAFYPAVALYDAASACTATFNADDLEYTPPDGFEAWPALAPTWGYGFSVPLPSDWLRNAQVGEDGEEADYKTEGGSILSDEQVLYLRYIWRNTDPDSWDSLLLDVVTQAMAASMAYATTQSTSKEEAEWNKLKMLMREARTVDGQDDPAQTLGDLRLISARY